MAHLQEQLDELFKGVANEAEIRDRLENLVSVWRCCWSKSMNRISTMSPLAFVLAEAATRHPTIFGKGCLTTEFAT